MMDKLLGKQLHTTLQKRDGQLNDKFWGKNTIKENKAEGNGYIKNSSKINNRFFGIYKC